jgi:hypothetical protein
MKLSTRDYSVREHARPEPDEAELEPVRLSPRELLAAMKRAAKAMLEDNMLMIASALAYSTFFAIPSVLLLAVGLFTLIAGPQTITSLIQSFGHVMPAQATQLLGSSLHRLDHQPGTTILMTVVGFVLAVWATTSAMTSYMTAVNIAYKTKDTRNFVRKRMIALAMAACIGFAFVLVAVLLIFGPQIEKRIGSAIGAPSLVAYLWWAAQWPILVVGLLREAPLEAHHCRRGRRGGRVARRVGPVRGLHGDVRLLQQDLGIALGRDRDAHLALALQPRTPLRRGAERPDRGEPRAPPRHARPRVVPPPPLLQRRGHPGLVVEASDVRRNEGRMHSGYSTPVA